MPGIIKNYNQLASSPLRKAALDIIEIGLKSLQSQEIILANVKLAGADLIIKDIKVDLSRFSKIVVVGIGKAGVGMGQAMEKILDGRISGGFILDRKRGNFNKLTSFVGSHPDPSFRNVEATNEILDYLKSCDAKTLILLLISGGGSALLTAPFKIPVAEKANLARRLMNAGSTIQELNVVRRHLSEVKGGHLARLAYPATVVSLILSDVPGDDLTTIASGPTVFDPSTVLQAQQILDKYGLVDRIEFNETPKDEKYFERVTNVLLANASVAIEPMQQKAQEHGFEARIYATNLTGEADSVGKDMITKISPGHALIASGETTVSVRGSGLGGRNQQLVLSTLPYLQDGQLVASIGTDGHDNSDLAGAIGDTTTVQKANEHHLDPLLYAQNNDAYTFFKAIGDGLETGELDSNFADLMLVLWQEGVEVVD